MQAEDLLQGLPGVFRIVKCGGCGLVRTNPRPTLDTIGSFYPTTYAPHNTAHPQVSSGRIRFRKLLKKTFAGLIQFNSSRMPPVPIGSALEIGCGSGAYLDRLRSDGWKVKGIEFSAFAADAATRRGLDVHHGPVEAAGAPEAPYNAIVAWMVLEHLHDPVVTLRTMRSWITDDGYLALSVPVFDGPDRRLFGRYWYALQVPNHLFHFTVVSLSEVLTRSGWKVEKVMYERVLGNWIGSLGLVVSQRLKLRRLGSCLIKMTGAGLAVNVPLYPLALLLAGLRSTGRVTVWARPKKEKGARKAP